MGRAIAHAFAAEGHALQLAARNAQSLGPDKTDLELRYQVPVSLHEFDALDTAGHPSFVDALPNLPEIAITTIGYMGDQTESEQDFNAASLVLRSNFEGPASILSVLANRFADRGHGTLVGISSVAGDRGRATNYVYGSAKAGFTAYLSGLRNRLSKQCVHVATVLPGFVATQMTEGMDLPAPLTAQPDEVGKAILRAVTRKQNVIYVRPVWRVIMAIIRNIPEGIFKGMKL